MPYGLLDLIKSKHKKRNEKGYVEYQSLPEGVKEVFCSRFMFLVKDWFVTFQGPLDLDKLGEICKEKNYLVINAEQAKNWKLEAWKEEIKQGMRAANELFKESGSDGFSKEVLNLGLDVFKPDIAYRVYKGRKEIAYVCWYGHDNTVWFTTSHKNGLELAENYRRCLLNQ